MTPITRTTAQLLLLLALPLVVTGCGSAGDGPEGVPEATVRDSSGVRIVENRLPQGETPAYATVTPEPLGVLPRPESDLPGMFDPEVRGAVTFPDGRTAVAYAGIFRILIHQGDSVVWRAGGRGSGPGRFLGMGAMGRAGGDTLWVADPVAHQLTLLEPGGLEGREADLPFPGTVLGRFGDGSFLAVRSRASSVPEGGEGVVRDTLDYLRWWPASEERDTTFILSAPGPERLTLQPDSGEAVTIPAPLARGTSVAVGPGRVYVADQERFEILGLEPDGTLRERILLEGLDRTAPPDLRSTFALVDERGQIPSWADRFWDFAPEERPAFGRVLLDAMGHLWVSEHVVTGAPPRTWLVFAPDGQLRGRVDLPAELRLLEVGVGHVLGVAPGTGEVRRHGLQRR